jgi:molecular chaperone GrpE
MNEEIKLVNDDIDTTAQTEDINYKDLYIRLLADHDNYVKRNNKNMMESIRRAQSNVMNDVVMTIYNDLNCAVEQNVEGADLLLSKMKNNIEKLDYDVIDISFITDILGSCFDTDYCEAISTMPCTDEYDANEVMFVTKVGLYDKRKKNTVTHAQCIVAN